MAPLTTLKGWEEELMAEGTPRERIQWLAGFEIRKRIAHAGDATKTWFLINYESVRSWPGIGLMPWDVVILDESTRIKNPQAQVTKVVTRKLSDVPCRAILTGLPNPEGAMDYFTQMQFVEGGSFMGFGNFWAWRDALFVQIGYDWVPRRGQVPSKTSTRHRLGTRERIKEAVMQHAFIMSRKDAGVGSILVREKRVVSLLPTQRSAIREIKRDFKFHDLETNSAGTQHVWLQRIAGGFSPDRENPELVSPLKGREILALLKGELKGESLVVWFHFNEELGYVYHMLKANHITVVALLGSTPVEKRFSRIKKFQRGEAQVVCVQERLGMFGLDLSRADTEIYYSNSWSLEERNQSQDRIIHPKKSHPLLAIDLVTEDTTDEDVVDTLRDKDIDSKSFTSKLLSKIKDRLTDAKAAFGPGSGADPTRR